MAKILFFTWDGGGNQLPAQEIGLELGRRGHQVVFAGFETQRKRFTAAALSFIALPRSGDVEFRAAGWAATPAFFRQVMANPEHLGDTADVIAAEHPDAVIVDCLLFGALTAAEKSGIRWLTLIHTAPGALTGSGGGSAERASRLVEMINRLRALVDLPPRPSHLDVWGDAIVTTIPELDPADFQAPPTYHYIGPVLERSSTWSLPWSARDKRPLVLVSLSSTNAYGDQISQLQRVLDSLAQVSARVLVTAPAADASALEVPANAVVTGYTPHSAILPHASAAVSHAGHGSVAAALADGVPMVLIPNPMGDQPVLANRVEELGAGIALTADSPARAIHRAVSKVLANSSYRDRARELMQRIDRLASNRGADDIEAFSIRPLVIRP